MKNFVLVLNNFHSEIAGSENFGWSFTLGSKKRKIKEASDSLSLGALSGFCIFNLDTKDG